MREAMRKSLEAMKETSGEFIEVLAQVAHYNRAYYEHLVKQGFTKKEALELVARHGLTMFGDKGRD